MAGDGDYNDLVIRYRVSTLQDAAGGLSHLIFRVTPVAHGSVHRNGLALRIPVPATTDHIARVSTGGETAKLIDPLAGESELTFVLFESLLDAFPGAGAAERVNTVQGGPIRSGLSIQMQIEFAAPPDLLVEGPFDLFLFRTDHYPHQIHLSDFGPTDLGIADSAVADLFGSGEDCSDQVCVTEGGSSADNLGRYFVNQNGIPWALEFPGQSAWAQEGVPLKQGYPGFPQSLDVGGVMPGSWWSQRNALYLFPILAVPGLLPTGVGVLLSLLTAFGVWRLCHRDA